MSWYRVEHPTGNCEPFTTTSGGWIYNFWPLTRQYGFGAELLLVHSLVPIPAGIDVGIRAEYLWLNSPTGVNLPGVISIQTLRQLGARWVRGTLNLSVAVSSWAVGVLAELHR